VGIIYSAHWYRVNVQRSKVNGDKWPLSPNIPPDLDANSISDNHPFLYANLFIQLYFSTAWLFNEGRTIFFLCSFAMAQNIIFCAKLDSSMH
jgi:hypothetical protein